MKQYSIKYLPFVFGLLSIICWNEANGQMGISLQVEVINSLEIIEYYQGQKMEFTLKAYPDEWRKEIISEILVQENVILFDGEIVKIDQIDKVRRPNFGAKLIGGMLFTFGTSWNIFGFIASLTTDFEFRGRELFIGLASMGTGYLISKLLQHHTYNIDNGARLRIIDRRFSIEES